MGGTECKVYAIVEKLQVCISANIDCVHMGGLLSNIANTEAVQFP